MCIRWGDGHLSSTELPVQIISCKTGYPNLYEEDKVKNDEIYSKSVGQLFELYDEGVVGALLESGKQFGELGVGESDLVKENNELN